MTTEQVAAAINPWQVAQQQFDLAAEPMFSSFTVKPDFTPYTARPNHIPLDEMNPKLAGLRGLQRELAEFSMDHRQLGALGAGHGFAALSPSKYSTTRAGWVPPALTW